MYMHKNYSKFKYPGVIFTNQVWCTKFVATVSRIYDICLKPCTNKENNKTIPM